MKKAGYSTHIDIHLKLFINKQQRNSFIHELRPLHEFNSAKNFRIFDLKQREILYNILFLNRLSECYLALTDPCKGLELICTLIFQLLKSERDIVSALL